MIHSRSDDKQNIVLTITMVKVLYTPARNNTNTLSDKLHFRVGYDIHQSFILGQNTLKELYLT